MKRINLSFLVIIVALMALTVVYTGCGKSDNTVKIGAILPLTGNTAFLGEFCKNGFDLAVEKINNAGGINGKQLVLMYEDSKNDPKEGITAFNRLSMINVPVILTAMSSVASAQLPLAKEKKLVLFATTVSSKGFTEGNDWAFRLFITADVDAVTMAEYAYGNLNYKNVAIVSVNDEMGNSFTKVFTDKFTSLGGQIVLTEMFDKNETNYKNILTKLKQSNFDALYLLGYDNNLGVIPNQLRALSIKQPIMSIATISQDYVMKNASKALDGTYFTSTFFNPEKPMNKEAENFVAEYKTKYGKTPNYFAGFAYESVMLIAQAMKTNGLKSDQIRLGLLNIKDMNGVMGPVSIKVNGDASFPMSVKIIQTGKIVDAQ